MIGVMLLLGGAVFSVNTTTYDQITRSVEWQWQALPVIGKKPVYQYVGGGEQSISVTGCIYPGQYGSRAQLMVLEQAAGLGVPIPLFSGLGYDLGLWCINRYSEVEGLPFYNGCPQKIEFTIDLVKYAGLLDYLTQDYSAMIGQFVDAL